MNGVDRIVTRRKSLTERLGFSGIACCGATWGLGPVSVVDDDEDEDGEAPLHAPPQSAEAGRESPSAFECLAHLPAASGMNLAAALAAERHLRAGQDSDGERSPSPNPLRPDGNLTVTEPGTPLRVSLMRLLEETDGGDGETEREEVKEGVGSDTVCCVCMGRKKGAAFIPCGHTFCRVCSRELWLERGCCPLCNRSILEILDIY